MNHLDLFSGIGGFALAAEAVGFQTAAFCEIDPFCQSVLACHWPGKPNFYDICTLTVDALSERGIRDITLITGGFPCQDISAAGKGAGIHGERSRLWFEMLRVICEVRPAWVVAENTPALRTRGADIVLAGLEEAGYDWGAVVVGAWAVGAPHRRDRAFIVAHAHNCRCGAGFPDLSAWEFDSDGGGLGDSDSLRQLQSGGLFADVGRRAGDAGARLADPEGAKPSRALSARGRRAGFTDSGGSGPQAHSHRAGRGEQCGAEPMGAEYASAECGGASVGDAARQQAGGILLGEFPPNAGAAGDGTEQAATRATQSGLGRGADGVSAGLDGHRWPAPRGAQQEAWEPPRVAVGVANRAARLRALGNAVVPQQVYPILRIIFDWEAQFLSGFVRSA